MLPECLVAAVELLHRTGLEILNHDVCALDERKERLAVRIGPQVEFERAFPTVDALEVAAVGFLVAITHERRVRPDEVAAGAFDLYHVRAHVCEQHRTVRSGEDLCQVEHTQVVKRTHEKTTTGRPHKPS